MTDPSAERPDTRIAVVLRDDLLTWQRLNVTSFLVSGIGTRAPEVIGEAYEDADGISYLPMFRQPVLVFEGTKETLSSVHQRAAKRGIPLSVFTSDLFVTNNDVDNRSAVRAVAHDALDVVGVAMFGPKNFVDKVTKEASRHP